MSISQKCWLVWGICAIITVVLGVNSSPKEAVYGMAIVSSIFGYCGFIFGD